jgi:hypothetical protein
MKLSNDILKEIILAQVGDEIDKLLLNNTFYESPDINFILTIK